MAWKSEQNKNIKVDFVKYPNLVLTPVIDDALVALDPYFVACYATSGLRDSRDQLRVIRGYLKSEKLDDDYPLVMDNKLDPATKEQDGKYVWQLAWSNLLNKGIIINPPLDAVCLMDYMSGGINKKGKVIKKTNHSSGNAINLGGGSNGIDDELACVEKAIKAGVRNVVSFLAERKQNALHLNLRKV